MALTTVPASLSATALTLTTAAQPNITSVGTLTGLTVSGNIAGTLTTAAQTNITSLGTLTALTIDDITIDGSTISDAGEFTLDIGADIILDSDNGVWRFKDAGTSLLQIARDGSSSVHFYSAVSNMNMLFKGNDGGNTITALDLDMENGGRADFANDISVNDGRGLRLGSDDDSIIYNDGSNLYVKNNTSNQDIIFQGNDDGSASLEMLKLDSSNLGAATFSGSVTANAGVNVDTTVIDSYIIRQNTSDGSDNSQLSLTGGGADSDGRGARARLYGNEHSSKGGDVDISTGNIANAQMDLYATGNFSVDAGGQIILDADTQGSGNGILLKDAGTHYGSIFRSSSHLHIKAEAQDKNLLFLTNNGGSELTALTLASDGTATFSGSVTTTNVTANNASEGDTYFTGGTANSRLLSIFTSTNDGGANAGHNFKIASGQGAFIFGNATTANLLKVQTGGIAVSGIATFSGKVGIGRTPAFAQLEIQADKTLANNLHIQMNGASNTNKQMIMGFDTTTDESHIISQIAGSALKPLIITADKVAIGGTSTLNPVAKLHVETSTNTPLYLKSSASAGGYVQYGLGPSGANLGYMGSGSQLASGGSSSDLSIRAQANLTFATGGATERMRIDSSGNVGIGNASPGSALHITKGSGAGHNGIRIDNTTSYYGQLNFYTTGGNRRGFVQSAGGGALEVGTDSGSGNLQLYSGGQIALEAANNTRNIGIGITPDANYKVKVYSGDYYTMKLRAPTYPVLKFEAINQSSGNNGEIGISANNTIYMQPNNTTAGIRINNDGIVTAPNQPYVQGRGNGGWTAYSGSAIWEIQPHGSTPVTSRDHNSDYSTSNKRFTCPVDGVYLVQASWYIYQTAAAAAGSQYVHPALYRNGSLSWNGGHQPYTIYGHEMNRSGTGSKHYDGIQMSFTIYCSANDYLDIRVYTPNANTQSYENYHYFSYTLLN